MKYQAWLIKYMTKEEIEAMNSDNPEGSESWSYQQASEYIGRHQIEAYKRWEKRHESK